VLAFVRILDAGVDELEADRFDQPAPRCLGKDAEDVVVMHDTQGLARSSP
jgi:hypothetical protein